MYISTNTTWYSDLTQTGLIKWYRKIMACTIWWHKRGASLTFYCHHRFFALCKVCKKKACLVPSPANRVSFSLNMTNQTLWCPIIYVRLWWTCDWSNQLMEMICVTQYKCTLSSIEQVPLCAIHWVIVCLSRTLQSLWIVIQVHSDALGCIASVNEDLCINTARI